MIGGVTDYDTSGLTHDLALDLILAEWRSAGSYASRIKHIVLTSNVACLSLNWNLTA